MLVTPW